ncbi:MAG: methionyl-tRNA formyltransferase [Dehalococcoidia bacterium]
MRIALIGQAAFGEAVFTRLRDQGEQIVAVSSIEGAPGRPDPLWAAAEAARLPPFPTGKLKKSSVLDAWSETKPDLCVMAFVNHILPERVLEAPPLGTIQYHPSLLPRHRGRSSINWAIAQGDGVTGITVFWVDKGIDTGPILLQKEVPVGPDDTVASLYFDHLFPLGVDAMAEAVRLVREGNAPRITQDETRATYEQPADDTTSAIDWAQPAQDVYNLVRGSNPQPGAHAMLGDLQVRFFDARMSPEAPPEPPGTVLAVGETIDVALAGGILRAMRLQAAGGKKIAATELAAAHGVTPRVRFANGALPAP